MAACLCFTSTEKKHWWLTNRMIVEKYIKDAKSLIATQEQNDVVSALNLLDSALALSPRLEVALALKAKSLLFLRRFKDVADMLQDYIPSLKMADDSVSADYLSRHLSRERAKLLPSGKKLSDSMSQDPSFKCFSVSELKKKVMVGHYKSFEKEGQWRYLVLGQACCHLGLMEDAMVLLQTGKRLSTAAFRRQSNSWSEDGFFLSNISFSEEITSPPSPPRTESESISKLLSHIKFLLRRKIAALAALEAGLHSEAIRHFTKVIEGRRGAPQGFLSECYMYRAFAFKSSGRIADSIADCNKTLALDPTCIQALETRAVLLEMVCCLPDSLHELEHLKLLYNTILRDRKLPGPAWKRHNVSYREIPGKLCSLTTKIQELKQRVASGETRNVDYYALMGLRRGCSSSELERACLLLTLRHKPDRAMSFVERCELADSRDLESVKDRAKMSTFMLYRLIQKGYSNLMTTIIEEEAVEKERKKAAAATLQATKAASRGQRTPHRVETSSSSRIVSTKSKLATSSGTTNPSIFRGVFCRDLAAVGNLLSQVGFTVQLP